MDLNMGCQRKYLPNAPSLQIAVAPVGGFRMTSKSLEQLLLGLTNCFVVYMDQGMYQLPMKVWNLKLFEMVRKDGASRTHIPLGAAGAFSVPRKFSL